MTVTVHRVGTVELRVTDSSWAWAVENRAIIEAHWAQRLAANPQLWNGGHLMTTDVVIDGDRLTARVRRTDFASFLTWRDMGWPDRAAWNAFGSCALHGSDGALIVGRNAAWTANAGKTYLIGGSLEPRDIGPDGVVDIDGSIANELAEETGLAADVAVRAAGWTVILDGQRLSLARRLDWPEPAAVLAARIRARNSAKARPELDDVLIVRGAGDLDPAITPPYALAYAAML